MEILEHNQIYGQNGGSPKRQRDIMPLIAVVLAAVAIILAIAAITLSFTLSGKKGSSESSHKSAYDSVKNSVVCVVCPDSGENGSGVIYSAENGKTLIITNYHVVKNSSDIKAVFSDYGKKESCTLLGYDEYHDIALLSTDVENGTPVKAAKHAQTGEDVIVVGNTLGAGISAHDGIISRTNRLLKFGEIKRVPVYAVSSPVNRGASGSGLFNLSGEIVGINTYQTEAAAGFYVDGISYSVPYPIADKIARKILAENSNGQIEKLAVEANKIVDGVIDLDGLCFAFAYNVNGMPTVTDVFADINGEVLLLPDSGGSIQEGDVIISIGELEFDGTVVMWEIFDECLKYSYALDYTGKALTVTVKRNGQTVKLTYNGIKLRYN